MSTADAASLSSLISSCKELRLYSENLLSAALARAKALLQAQLQGGPGFSAGLSARQLGVVLHSLAVMGLKPSDGWLRLAVVTAGGWLHSGPLLVAVPIQHGSVTATSCSTLGDGSTCCQYGANIAGCASTMCAFQVTHLVAINTQ
jgi:hypothetical protein